MPIIDPGILVPNPAAGQDTSYFAYEQGLEMNLFVREGDFETSAENSTRDYAGYYMTQVRTYLHSQHGMHISSYFIVRIPLSRSLLKIFQGAEISFPTLPPCSTETSWTYIHLSIHCLYL